MDEAQVREQRALSLRELAAQITELAGHLLYPSQSAPTIVRVHVRRAVTGDRVELIRSLV